MMNSLNKRFEWMPRWTWATLLVGAGLLSGVVPSLTPSLTLSFEGAALAQSSKKPAEPTAEEIANFVRSAVAMEPKRKEAFEEIRAVMNQVPTIRCDEDQSFTSLDPRVRGVAIKYCNGSKKIVESSGLTVVRFNEILLLQREDKGLKQRIQAETCRFAPNLCPNR